MMKTTPQKSLLNSVGAVVHRLPGRLRVRIERLRDDPVYGNELQQAVSAISGVITVRINPSASSVVITYLASKLPEQTLLDYLGVPLPTSASVIDSDINPNSKSSSPNHPHESLNKEAETIGETIGEAVGEAVGEVLLGPLGMAVGAVIGGEIGGQIGEASGLDLEQLIDSKLQNRPTQRHNRKNNKPGT